MSQTRKRAPMPPHRPAEDLTGQLKACAAKQAHDKEVIQP
jgi:hypothetical protein